MQPTPAELYEFELRRRTEINENLRHTFQLCLAEIGFLAFVVPRFPQISEPAPLLIFSIWMTLTFAVIALTLCGFAYIYFKTAFPNTAEEIEKYRISLELYDKSRADKIFSDFVHERFVQNATKNSKRNRMKSLLSFCSRVLLALSGVPLIWIVLCYISTHLNA